MVIENDPSARMQVRSMGELMHPAQCMVCGNGMCEEGYLDLGVFYDYEGTMYLCKTCCYQAGETFGMFTPDEVMTQQRLINTLSEDNDFLKKELEDARPIISVFKSAVADLAATSTISTVATDEITRNVNAESEGTVSGPEGREPEPEKSVKKSRSGNSGRSKSDNAISFK